jgi:hypothetical protein
LISYVDVIRSEIENEPVIPAAPTLPELSSGGNNHDGGFTDAYPALPLAITDSKPVDDN